MVLGLGTSEHPLFRIRVLEARDLAALSAGAVRPDGDSPVISRDGYGANPLAVAPGAHAHVAAVPVLDDDVKANANAGVIPGVSGSEVDAERLAHSRGLATTGVLANGRLQSIPDPRVSLSLKGLLKKKFNTQTIPNTIHPVWNEEFIFEPKHAEKDLIVLKVRDSEASSGLLGSKNVLGQVRIPVIDYLNRGIIDEWRPLVTKNGLPARGDIRIQIAYGTNFPAPLIGHDSIAAAPTGSTLLPGTAGYGQGGILPGQGGILPGQGGILPGQGGILPGQAGYGQPGYGTTGLGTTTGLNSGLGTTTGLNSGLAAGQPGYVAPQAGLGTSTNASIL